MITAFLDTDVIISSLLSQTGAANLLLKTPQIRKIISNASKDEIVQVSQRLNISNIYTNSLFKSELSITSITKEDIAKYVTYVTDQNDAHIIAGAHVAKVVFLVTYNRKDFKVDKIKNELKIITLSPGEMLQFLRTKTN